MFYFVPLKFWKYFAKHISFIEIFMLYEIKGFFLFLLVFQEECSLYGYNDLFFISSNFYHLKFSMFDINVAILFSFCLTFTV